jgi:histidinol phosphatase-like enzyme (inositol monophosphatase family)
MQDYAAKLPEMMQTSGEIILSYFRSDHGVEQKQDDTPVTQADQQAEAAIRAIIREHWPEHGIVGEEAANENTHAEWQWVIDPIDGTRNFIAGKPLFTTLIGLCHHGKPVMGAAHQPYTGERWVAHDGAATFNDQAIRTRRCDALEDAWLATTSPHLFNQSGFAKFEKVREQCQEVHYGGDAYHYAMLAQGRLDLVIEEDLQFYDIAALIPLVEAAGGIITDWQGAPLTLNNRSLQVVAAGDAALHQQALEALQ